MHSRNARLGHLLFVLYTLLYGAFVLLNVFRPKIMEATPFLGLNLAILCGFGLIVAAFLFAMVYGLLCTADGDVEPNAREPRDGEGKS